MLEQYYIILTEIKYTDRWMILMRNKFDPLRDIIKDSKGLYRLEGSKISFRDDIFVKEMKTCRLQVCKKRMDIINMFCER